jgi:hypothetical protein
MPAVSQFNWRKEYNPSKVYTHINGHVKLYPAFTKTLQFKIIN